MTHRSQLADKNRKRRLQRTEYRRALEQAFKAQQQELAAAESGTVAAKTDKS